MKFNLSIKDGDKYIIVGNARPSKSGKAWQLTIFNDKKHLLQQSQCGKYLTCIMTQDTRPSFGGAGTPQSQAITPADWTPSGNSLKTDLPF